MATEPVPTRLPEEAANHVRTVAESPATDLDTPSEVVRQIVTDAFDTNHQT